MRLGPLLRPHLDSLDLVQSVFITLLKGLRNDKFHIAGPACLPAVCVVVAGVVQEASAASPSAASPRLINCFNIRSTSRLGLRSALSSRVRFPDRPLARPRTMGQSRAGQGA